MHYLRHFSKRSATELGRKKSGKIEISQNGGFMARISLYTSVILVLVCGIVPASAQQPPDQPNEIRCAGGGTTCKTSFFPVFSSNGGSATVKDSIIKQSGASIAIAGSAIVTSSASSPAFVGNSSGSNAVSDGVDGVTGSGSASGVAGINNAGGVGVYGTGGTGLFGTGSGLGAYGQSSGIGVFGQHGSESGTGQSLTGILSGAWGDGGADANYGVVGSTDNKTGGLFYNNGGNYYTVFGFNSATGGTGYPWAAINADGAGCNVDPLGDLSCTGSKNAVVPINSGKQKVALSAIESPKNWFEDFGSEQLRGGVATVRLDPKFTQTINTKLEYHVFLTPKGDCKGLYVHQETPTSFEVRELGGGNSSVRFDYRITALRKNYEKVRFADHSREFSPDRTGRVFATNQ
jgi:hypothetical protein